MNKVYKKYISNVTALFPVKGKAEKKYINNFKINVLDYSAKRRPVPQTMPKGE